MNTVEPNICYEDPIRSLELSHSVPDSSISDNEVLLDPKIQKRNEYARKYYRKKYQENEEYRALIREKTKKAYYKRKSELEMLKKLYKDSSLVTV